MTERSVSDRVEATGAPPAEPQEATPRPGRPPTRRRRTLAAVPRPLVALLGVVALIVVAWAALVPALQPPDEGDHFEYVQSLVERHHLPNRPGHQQGSTEQKLAARRAGGLAVGSPLTKVEWSARAYERWRRDDKALGHGARTDGGGSTGASLNPPLYYAYAGLVYKVVGGDFFNRLFLMRVASALLLLGAVAATWLLAGELFGRNRPLQLAAAAVVGLQPMETFISASVSPDTMLFPLWATVFWLGARILRRGLTPARAAALLSVTGAAVLVKSASYALGPAVLFVLAVGILRLRRESGRRAAISAAAAAIPFVLVAGGWILRAIILHRTLVSQVGTLNLNPGEFASYLWQFYLPRLPFQTRNPGIGADSLSQLGVYAVWLKTGWGAFASLEVRFPEWVYVLLAAFSVLVLAAGLWAVLGRRLAAIRAPIVFLGLAALGLVAGLHWTEYRIIVDTGRGTNQGRYLLPLLPIAGVATAAALSLLAPAARRIALGLLLGGFFVLQLFSMAIVAGRFYA
jgi:4-amino-4-deoxy-L-arabinose transferase-like glycosyltransferase